MKIPTVPIGSWADIQAHAKQGWVFRGQRDAKWNLETSLERVCNREVIKPTERLALEASLLRDFKRGLHHYTNEVPERDHNLEWLSVMQHHGAPTRLLDFTYSIYVATYFALEAADADSAVWAVHGPSLLEAARRSLSHGLPDEAKILRNPRLDYGEENPLISKLLESTDAPKSAIPLNPFRLNERLRIQKGIFLIPSNLSCSFMENLASLPDGSVEPYVKKLEIKKTERRPFLEQLFNMSITRTSLFPGLDGYAQSLGVYHNSHNPLT